MRPVPPEPVVARVAQRGDVVEQRVEPDVGHEAVVERERDAPLEPALRAADRQVLERLAQEAQELVPVALGLDDVRMVLEVAPAASPGTPTSGRSSSPPRCASAASGGRGTCRRRSPSPCRSARTRSSTARRTCRSRSRPASKSRWSTAWTTRAWPRLGRPDEVVVGDARGRPTDRGTPASSGRRAPAGPRRRARPPGRSCRRARRCPSGRRRRRRRAGGSAPACRPRSSCTRGRDAAAVDVVDRRREVERRRQGSGLTCGRALPRELGERDLRLRPVGEADEHRFLEDPHGADAPLHAAAAAALGLAGGARRAAAGRAAPRTARTRRAGST